MQWPAVLDGTVFTAAPGHRAQTAAAAVSFRQPALTVHDLQLLAALAQDNDGAARRLAAVYARSAVPERTARNAARRLAAAGLIAAAPSGTGAPGGRPPFRLTAGGRAAAGDALGEVRSGIALALYALEPGSGAVPVPAVILAACACVRAALILRAFLDGPAQPWTYRDLQARTGLSVSSIQRALVPMAGAGWVADVPPTARAGGRPAHRHVLAPAGLAAFPDALAAARGQLTDLARSFLPAAGDPAGPAVPHRAVSRLLAAELAGSPWGNEPPALYVIHGHDGFCRLRRIGLPPRSWHGRRPQDVIAGLSVPSARAATAEPATGLLGVAVLLPGQAPHREDVVPARLRSVRPPASGEWTCEEARLIHGVDLAGMNYAFTQLPGSAETADRSRSRKGGIAAALRLLLDAMAAARRIPPGPEMAGQER